MRSGENKISHLAIIPDGNRRWAKSNKMALSEGYKKAGDYEKLMDICKKCTELKIKTLSIWAFSTENWNRNAHEKKLFLTPC